MKREKALEIVAELNSPDKLGRHISYGQVCGSIRREQPEVNDIDFVIIPKQESVYLFGEELLDTTIKRLHQGTIDKPMLGEKIKRFFYKGISIDIYIATQKNFETLKLIRTGSKYHNVRLTTIAKQRGHKLFADGRGYCKIDGDGNPTEVIEDTEKGIIENLLGRYVEPKDRD